MSATTLWFIIGALGVLGGLLVLYIVAGGRWYNVNEEQTYIIRDWKKPFKRTLRPGVRILWNPQESVIKGDRQSLFEFPSIDSMDQRAKRFLRDEKTGSINLKPQICALNFTARTNEPLTMRVTAQVRFRANQDKLESLHRLGDNFGIEFVGRVQQAFSQEFGRRDEQNLQEEIDAVAEGVFKTLNELERSDPLGVHFVSLNFKHFQEREPVRAGRSGAVVGGGAITEGHEELPSPPAGGVAFLEASDFAVIMNLFDSPEQKMQALLSILEMQTRRDIAEALSRSPGQLVVVTAQELGLTSTAMQLEAMRSHRETDGAKAPRTTKS